MTENLIALSPRGEIEAQRACVRRMPYSVEHVVSSEGGFDFAWSGASAYLALHDIVSSSMTAEWREMTLRLCASSICAGA